MQVLCIISPSVALKHLKILYWRRIDSIKFQQKSSRNSILSSFRNLTDTGICLSNGPGKLQKQIAAIYGNNTFPGRIFPVDDQCKLISGSLSFYCKGVWFKNFIL